MKAKEFKERLTGKLYSIEAVNDSYREETSEADPDDKWSRASTHTDHNIQGFNVFSERHFGDVMVPYEPAKDTNYYLLYVVYSTGDSFGHDSGNCVEYIGLYTEEELHVAKENKRRIEEHNRNQKSKLKLLLPNVKDQFDIYVPWHGFFESLDYTNIAEIQREN